MTVCYKGFYYRNKLEGFLDNYWHWLYLKFHLWGFAIKNRAFGWRYLLSKLIGTKLFIRWSNKYDVAYNESFNIETLKMLLGMKEPKCPTGEQDERYCIYL